MEVKIYLKSKRKPFVVLFDSQKQFQKFYDTLLTTDIIKVGPIIFDRAEFQYAVISD